MRNVRDFGAVGDGIKKDTVAIQSAVDAGGIVFFPPGIYLCGTIYLRSNGGLELAPGAVLLGSPDRTDYNTDDFCRQNRVFTKEHVSGAHLITAVGQQNIVLRGEGRIDGNRKAFYGENSDRKTEFKRNGVNKFSFSDWRPGQMIFLCECSHADIHDLELYHAPYWTCCLHECEQVCIRGVRIWNDQRTRNGDGIDLDCCRFVNISDCQIYSGDDCITLRAYPTESGKHSICEYVTVTNCILQTVCNGIRIGVGTGVVRRGVFSNIIMRDTTTGIQIVSRYDDMTPPGVQVEEINFNNMIFEGKRLFSILSNTHGIRDGETRPIRRLNFSQIQGNVCGMSMIESNRLGDISDLSFNNLSLFYEEGDNDIQTTANGLGYGEFGNNVATNGPAAIHAANVCALRFRNVDFRFLQNRPEWRYGLWAIHIRELQMNECSWGKPNQYEKIELG